LRRAGGKKFKIFFLLIISLFFLTIIIVNSTVVQKSFYPMKYKEHVFKYAVENKVNPYRSEERRVGKECTG
jgi:hypothetical protein